MNDKLLKIIFLILLNIPFSAYSQREKAFEINNKLGRGINFGNMFEAPTETGWGNQWQPEYAKIVANLGFNHVRIPIRWEPVDRSYDSIPYTINPTFLNRIKQVVDSALNNGLYAIINMHHHEKLYENPENQKNRFLAQWEQISDFFKNYSDSLLFEVLNEPHGKLDASKWNVFLNNALHKIRINNPHRIVLIGIAEHGGLGGLQKLQIPDDQDLILSAHYYNPFQFTHQGASWAGETSNDWLGTEWTDTETERTIIRQDFTPLLELSQQKKIPIHIGEFGAYNKADIISREKWTTFLARYFEELNWSWAYWEFSAGFGIYNPSSKTYIQPLVNALLQNKMPEPTQVNLTSIYKSNFQYSSDGWVKYQQSGASSYLTHNNKTITVSINNKGTETWHVQLVLNNIKLYANKKYQISFTVKANERRSLNAYTGKSSAPWTSYSGNSKIKISDSFIEYSYIFDMIKTDKNSRIVFDLGTSEINVTFSEIKLDEVSIKTNSININSGETIICPNPVKTSFQINSTEHFSDITLFNLFGEKVFTRKVSNHNPINISELKPGMYILNLKNEYKSYSCKIIKE